LGKLTAHKGSYPRALLIWCPFLSSGRNAGYQLGSHLKVQNSSSANRIGLDLTQKGAIVGTEPSL
jgi:hypothetical protein